MEILATVMNDTVRGTHFGCAVVMTAIAQECEKRKISVVHCAPLDSNQPISNTVAQAIRRSNIVIVNGEGVLHDDNKRTLALAAFGPYCREHQVRSALVNASIYKVAKALPALKCFDLIYTRDIRSAQALHSGGVGAEPISDLSFSFDFKNREKSEGICFSDSVDRRTSAVLAANAFLTNADFHRIGKNDRLKNFREYVDHLASYKLVVTGRYHGACFCINAGIPFVAVRSNTNKIEDLLEEALGSAERVLPLEKFAMNDWISQFRALVGPKFGQRELRGVCGCILRNFDDKFSFSAKEEQFRSAYKSSSQLKISHMWDTIALEAQRGAAEANVKAKSLA